MERSLREASNRKRPRTISEHGRDDHGGGQTGQTGHNAGAQSGKI